MDALHLPTSSLEGSAKVKHYRHSGRDHVIHADNQSYDHNSSGNRLRQALFCTSYKRKVGVTRLHMEEDSAKMNHQGAESLAGSTHSLVDFNRAGIPLAEIVSEPDMRTGIEAAEYGRELQRVRLRSRSRNFLSFSCIP